MKKTLTNQFGSAILDAFGSKNFERRYLEKTKMLNNSKSAKSIPIVHNIDNAFKKGNTKIEVQDLSKSKREKLSINKQQNIPSKVANMSNKTEKSTPFESNKFTNNTNAKEGLNQQQFLTRNQLFEKQKQLKLQYQRRKQLYGIASDLKFKPSLIIKPNQDIKSDQSNDNQQKSKSYKLMYEKKYGKFKIQENNSKKKSKKYEQLMKESMLRFQQKFKQLGQTHLEKRKIKQIMLDIQDKNKQKRTEQLIIQTQSDEQVLAPSKASDIKPNVEDIDKKIKFLMQKLQIQDQFNDSIESISELSRIQLKSEIKGSQMSSSNLFYKFDNQTILKEDFIGFQAVKQLQDHSLANIDKKHQEETINQHHSLQQIEQPPAQSMQQQHDNLNIKRIQQQIQQKQPQIQKLQDSQNAITLQNKKLQIYYVEPRQGQANQQQINSQCRNASLIQQNVGIQTLQNKEVLTYIDTDVDQNTKMKEQSTVMFEDMPILEQKTFRFHQMQSFSFKQIQYPRVSYKIFQKSLANSHRLSEKNVQIQIAQAQLQNLDNQILSNRLKNLENSQQQQSKKSLQSQPYQQFDKQQSSQDQYETHIESFIDLHGNFIEDVQVYVQNFGYCRFLAIEEESERHSQDSYS